MKKTIHKFKIILFPVLFYNLISCGATLPLQEISTAKQEISRAKLFNSERYAKTDLDGSRSNLLLAHENAFGSKPDFKKVTQLSQASTESAREAIKKSLPNYVKDLQKEVEESLEAASSALAEELASDLYEQANLLKTEGDEIIKNSDLRLNGLSAENSSEKAQIYEEYEKGIARYRESIAVSEKARDLSLSQSQAIIDSSNDIETNLDMVEKFSNGDENTKKKITSLRDEYKSSVNLIETGKVKDGFKKLEEIRSSTNELMTSIILPYAKERIKIATVKIEEAEKLVSSETTSGEKSVVASDDLTASKEAFTSSVDLLAKGRYYDSIQQSDESIRLAEDIVKSESESETDYAIKNRASKAQTETDTKEDNSVEKNNEESKDSDLEKSEKVPAKKNAITKKENSNSTSKWKKHIVRKKKPPETLWRIAADKKYYGDRNRWKEIYNANKKKISNPNLIYPNQILLIPTKKQSDTSNKSKK